MGQKWEARFSRRLNTFYITDTERKKKCGFGLRDSAAGHDKWK